MDMRKRMSKSEREAEMAKRAAIAAATKRDTTPVYRSNRPFSIWADPRTDPK